MEGFCRILAVTFHGHAFYCEVYAQGETPTHRYRVGCAGKDVCCSLVMEKKGHDLNDRD